MHLVNRGASLLSVFSFAIALAPSRSGYAAVDMQDPLALQTLPLGNQSSQLAELRKKISPAMWGFLKKEDRLHPHYHIGTKEQRAQQQAAATLELLRLLRPCASCAQYQRYGSTHAGGYVMCAEMMQGISAVYSFGTDGNFDWSADVSKNYSLPAYQFDCNHGKHPTCLPKTSCQSKVFHECIGLPQGDSDSRIFRSLQDHLERHTPLHGERNSKDGDVLLKVDVGGQEWNAFMDARLQDLRRMRQIVIEFHSLSRVEFHESYSATLHRILKAGFVVAHIHGNNYGSMALFGDGRFRIADNLQVTFVNKHALPARIFAACRDTQDKLVQDAVDNPFNFDLPIPRLPADHETITPSRVHVLRCRWWCSIYAFILGIGPFVFLAGVFLIATIALGLLVSRPNLSSLSGSSKHQHSSEKLQSSAVQ